IPGNMIPSPTPILTRPIFRSWQVAMPLESLTAIFTSQVGRDANNVSLSAVWDYNIAADTWTQKNNMPGCQNNIRGSAVALKSLFVFGGSDPFIVPGSPTSKSKLSSLSRSLSPRLAKQDENPRFLSPITERTCIFQTRTNGEPLRT